MSVTITGKQIEIGDSLKDFISNETETTVGRYMTDVHDAHITVTKDANHLFKTDITLHVGHSFTIHCIGSDTDPYKSVSHAIERLESQIRRYKTRLRDKKRHTDHEKRAEFVQKFIIKPQEEDTHDDNPLIIAEQTSEIHTLSVGDAVMRMDLLQAPVVLFRNAANNELNIVYRRPDGHVGWIDPSRKAS